MNKTHVLLSLRLVMFAALASVTGCSSAIEGSSGISTAPHATRFSAYVEDRARAAESAEMPAAFGRGYGYLGG
jgi:hypothetical protein